MFDFLLNNSLSRAELSEVPTEYLNVHYGDVLIKYGEVLDVASSEMTYLKKDDYIRKFSSSILVDGDIIMTDAAEDETVGKCSEIVGLNGLKAISGLHTIPLRPKRKSALGYLGYYMNSHSYHDQLLPLMQGTKVSSISKSAIAETKVQLPVSIDEQGKIGSYFLNLNHLITLHQRKV